MVIVQITQIADGRLLHPRQYVQRIGPPAEFRLTEFISVQLLLQIFQAMLVGGFGDQIPLLPGANQEIHGVG